MKRDGWLWLVWLAALGLWFVPGPAYLGIGLVLFWWALWMCTLERERWEQGTVFTVDVYDALPFNRNAVGTRLIVNGEDVGTVIDDFGTTLVVRSDGRWIGAQHPRRRSRSIFREAPHPEKPARHHRRARRVLDAHRGKKR